MDGTKSGDVILSQRTGSAVCVVTRVLEDGDETGPVEYMGALDAESRARRLAAETSGRVWVRVDSSALRPL